MRRRVLVNNKVNTYLTAKYNVTSTTTPTKIGYYEYTSGFSAIEIDGVEQSSVVSAYTFDTLGEHTVRYALADPTSIGKNAFGFCSGLTSINIPSGVTSIGNSTFDSCYSLKSITIPNSVTSIGYSAFKNCSGLTSINIPSSVTSIGQSAFGNCSSLTSITVDSNNTVYDSRNNCNAIIETSTNTLIQGCNNTIIPNNVTSIGDGAFSSCSGLTSIDIPNSVTSIGESAFTYCSGLTSINIPSGVTSISNYAFTYCRGLTSIEIPNSVTSIGDRTFYGCSRLTSITSNAVTAPTIQSWTFYNVKTNGTLYVPQGSSGYDTWMQNVSYYLGKYNWTKVEQ